MDYLALPPEVNSARMYAGPGAEPLLQAAGEWGSLAAELTHAAGGYRSTVAGLLSVWSGQSATAMAASANGYATWLLATAEQALQTAQSVRSAASAYYEAFLAIVPPIVIAVNRSQLTTLVATNLLGQNSSAIAANEAQYSEMWAQDVAAMIGYQANSASAVGSLPNFTPAPITAQPLASSVAPGAATGTSAVGSGLSSLLTLAESGWLSTYINSIISSAPTSNISGVTALLALFPLLGIQAATSQMANAMAAGGLGGRAIVNVPPMPEAAPKLAKVEAKSGAATSLGRLSTPPSWARPTPPEQQRVRVLPAAGVDGKIPVGMPAIPAVPVTGGRAKKSKRGTDPDDYPIGLPVSVKPIRHPSGG